MPVRTQIAGARVLITGGASGMGLLMARGALQRGASEVVVWDLQKEQVERAVKVLGERASGYVVDVSNPARVREWAKKVGDIDILINSAGVVTGKSLLENTDAAIKKTFAVNTLALYWTARAFLPGMIRQNSGCIVTMASAAGLLGVAGLTDYAPSKWAAIGFSESVRQELRKSGNNVNCLSVCPYYVDTGMFGGVRTKVPHLLPILKPGEVAEAALRGIEKGKTQVTMPLLVRALPLVKALPVAAFDAVMDYFGINQAMEEFHGRK